MRRKIFSILFALVLLLTLGLVTAVPAAADPGAGDINVQMVDIGTGVPFDGSGGEHIKLWGPNNSIPWVIMDKNIDAGGWARFTAAEIAAARVAQGGPGPFYYNISCYANGGAYSKVIEDGAYWGQFILYDSGIEKTYVVKTPPARDANQRVTWDGPNSSVSFDIDLGNYDESNPDWDWDHCHFETSQTTPCVPAQGDKPIMEASWLEERGYTYDDGGVAVGDWCYLTLEKASEGYSQTFGAQKADTDQWTIYLAMQQLKDGSKTDGTYDKTNKCYTLTFDPTNVFDPGNTWTASPSMVDGESYFTVLRINLLNTPEAGLSTTISPGSHYGVFHPIEWPPKAYILKDVPGKGLDKAPGLQKPFNPKSNADDHAGKK